MALWPRPPDEVPPPDLAAIAREVEDFAGGQLPGWEAKYLTYHSRRYADTLRLLPEGHGRRLLDVGSFPGHLSALAQARGWEVTGLNNDIESARSEAVFHERCQRRKITILRCDVERDRFPVPTGSFDAVLFCELLEHLYWNPFHTFKEIFRVLKPGGLLILTTPNLRRVETLIRYLRGWGHQAPVSRPFFELFPSILYHRHNREYTADEIEYFLARQGKDLYDFELDRVYYSDCLDAAHEIPGVKGQRVGTIELAAAGFLRCAFPGLRGQLMARASRSRASIVEWSSLVEVNGFGPLMEDEEPVQGFTRRLTFPFRATAPTASFVVPLPSNTDPVLLSLMVAYLAPDDAPSCWTRWSLDGRLAMTLELRPSLRPIRVRLFVPAQLSAHGVVRVAVETRAGRNPESGRELGLHVGGQWILAEQLATRPAIEAAINDTAQERLAEGSADDRWWHAAQSLYVPVRVTRSLIEMGPSDDAQLGPGWYHREDWGRLGTIRWTGPEAIAYLVTPGRGGGVRVRAYSGERRLGPVSGRLLVEHTALDTAFAVVGEAPFKLPADTWDELAVPVSAPAGVLRLTILVDGPRVPRELLPGSQDSRPLGLAVRRLWLT